MGWLSRVFGGSQNMEDRVREEYTGLWGATMGLSDDDARAAVDQMLAQVKAEAQAEGEDQLPNNFGDVLLAREASDEATRCTLAQKRAEGARDVDIRWWWNMHYLERGALLKTDEQYRMVLYLSAKERGLGANEAANEVWRYHPCLGDSGLRKNCSADDAPLPCELKDRINAYVERRSTAGLEDFKREIEAATSFNALVRAEIRKGKL